MKHRYFAKIYLVDGQIIENSSENLEEIKIWLSDQTEAALGDFTAEIFDNHTHKIIKKIQFSPPSD